MFFFCSGTQIEKDAEAIDATEHYGSPDKIASGIVAIVDCYCDAKHHNGPACDFGGAILLFGLEMACRTEALRERAKTGKIRAQPLSRGGSAFGSKHNTKIVYSGVIDDGGDDKPLESAKYKYFDKLHLAYLYQRMKRNKGVPTTKVRHDYILAFEDILFIVGEALSTNLEDEIIKILVSLVRMVIYVDTAYGIITTATKIFIVRCCWSAQHKKYLYKICSLKYCSNDNLTEQGKAFYGAGVMQIIKIIAAIIFNQQHDLPGVLHRNSSRVGIEAFSRSNISNRTIFPNSCAFYSGVNPQQLKDLPLRWQRDVFFNSWSRIQAAVTKRDAPKDVKKITLYQKDGVKVNITSEDCNIEEGLADGEPRDDDEDDDTSDTIFDSKIKEKLTQQGLSNFDHVREAATRIQQYIYTESRRKSPNLHKVLRWK